MLFELYFNSHGLIRRKGLKSLAIDLLFKLKTHQDFASSFDMIIDQLL